MTPTRYLVKENKDRSDQGYGKTWDLYRMTCEDAQGTLVASVFDKDTVELFLDAPVLRQMFDAQRSLPGGQAMSLRPSRASSRTLRDFSLAFVGFLRRLK